MATPSESKHAPSFSKMHCWVADGRAVARSVLWSAIPGVLTIVSLSTLLLIFGSHPILASLGGPNATLQAAVALLGVTALTFLVIATIRAQRIFRAHLRQGELVLSQTQTIISATHDGVIVLDEQGRIQSMNPAGEKMFGQPLSRVLGQNIAVLIPDRTVWQDQTTLPRAVVTTGQRLGNQSFPIDLRITGLTLEGRRSLVAMVRDASERGSGTDTLRQISLGVAPGTGKDSTRALLRQLSKAVGTPRTFVMELLGEGPGAVAMLTMAENGELRGTVATDLRNSVAAEVLGKGFRLIAENARRQYPEDAMLSDQGADAIAAMPLVDARGRALGVIGVLHDQRLEDAETIESALQILASRAAAELERKRAEEALSAEKERLAVTLRSIGEACITLDNDGRVVMFNPVAERLTGWVQEDATGRLANEVLHLVDERTRRRSQHFIQRIVTTGSSDAPGTRHILVSRDTEERVVETMSSPIRDRAGRKLGAIIVLRDVTGRRRAEEEQQKAEKLESLGLVAGGIAHDFNNILTTILGNVSLVLGSKEVPEPVTERLAAARKAAQRAQELAGQLLTFAKGGTPIKQTVNLGQFLIDTVNCATAGSRTTCDIQIAEDMWSVEADPGQLAQVIANLAVNADQAMPSGGTLHVTTENLELPLDSVSLGLRAGRWVRFSFEDHGVGIPDQYLKKIFDPYFTTKPTGAGLGLAAAYSIVTNHGGMILVESTPTVGSTFHVYLPASEKSICPASAGSAPAAPIPAGGGRVLILDDEEAICMLVTCALEPLGYEVTETQDGLVALEKYEEAMRSGRKYDLVISDLTMPGRMSGQEAIRRLREIDPEVRAIVSSGYANDPVMSRYQEFGFCGMIAKPYEIDALGRKVTEIMTQPDPRVIYHSFEMRKTA